MPRFTKLNSKRAIASRSDVAPYPQGLENAREVGSRWEAQAQQGLAQAERLKDLLQESAEWRLPQPSKL